MLKRGLRSPMIASCLTPFLRALIGAGAISAPAFTVTMTALSNASGVVTTRAFINPGSGGGGGVITPSVSAARTSGVAPLYVNIDATGTTSTLSTNAAHELYFATDFGDPSAGTWANGVQSAGLTSKNAGYGPVTGHVYETPGTYTVTTVITDGVNSETVPTTITVQDPNTVYAGASTICISHSGNFTGAPSGATQITAGSDDMYAAWNTHKASNKRILFCKADAWTCTAPLTMTSFAGLYLGGYGTGVAATFGSGTMVSVTPSSLNDSMFNAGSGNSDLRICNFKIIANSTTSAVTLNNSISGALLYKVEIRGGPDGFTAYPGSTSHKEFDQHCLYECLVDNLTDTGPNGHTSVFAGFVRGGVMGCYLDSCNNGEQTVRIPYIDRSHINNNYIARPNKTKNIIKIHSFDYTLLPLYSEKFIVSANVIDLRGGYSYNGTTVTEVGESYIVIGNGGAGGGERVRNGIVEHNYTYGCRGDPKVLYFISVNCPNMTVRNNIADFLLGSTSAVYNPTFASPEARFATVTTSTPDPTVGVRIYNNSLYSNMGNTNTGPFVWITNASTSDVVVKNNLGYLPYLGAFWADSSRFVYNPDGAAGVVSTNNTTSQTDNPTLVAIPPVALTDWRPNTGSYAINSGATVPVLRDFNNASRYGATYDMGAILP